MSALLALPFLALAFPAPGLPLSPATFQLPNRRLLSVRFKFSVMAKKLTLTKYSDHRFRHNRRCHRGCGCRCRPSSRLPTRPLSWPPAPPPRCGADSNPRSLTAPWTDGGAAGASCLVGDCGGSGCYCGRGGQWGVGRRTASIELSVELRIRKRRQQPCRKHVAIAKSSDKSRPGWHGGTLGTYQLSPFATSHHVSSPFIAAAVAGTASHLTTSASQPNLNQPNLTQPEPRIEH